MLMQKLIMHNSIASVGYGAKVMKRFITSKLQTSSKAKHNWVGKLIYWELCKCLKLHHTTKLYMPKAEFIEEKDMHKILWDFFFRQTDHRMKIKKRRRDKQILELCQRTKKTKNKTNKQTNKTGGT